IGYYQLLKLGRISDTFVKSFASLPLGPCGGRNRCYTALFTKNYKIERILAPIDAEKIPILGRKMLTGFEPIGHEIIDLIFHHVVKPWLKKYELREGVFVGVHQMRLRVMPGEVFVPAPEGIHQDGFAYIALY